MILIDDADRRVVEFLRVALRLGNDGERKRIDDEAEQHPVLEEAAQLLGRQPEDGGERAHAAYFSCRRSRTRLSSVSAGTKAARTRSWPLRSAKPSPLVKVPTLIGRK